MYKYLEKFKRIKMLNDDIEIHAFNLVARVANYNSDSKNHLIIGLPMGLRFGNIPLKGSQDQEGACR